MDLSAAPRRWWKGTLQGARASQRFPEWRVRGRPWCRVAAISRSSASIVRGRTP